MAQNVFGYRTRSLGGGFDIFRKVDENGAFGGLADRLPVARPFIIPAGTPCKMATAGVIKLLNYFKVETDSATSTVRVYKGEGLAVPVLDRNIMAEPATFATAGKSVSIDAIVESDTYYTLTLSSDLGSLVDGDLLCDADSLHASTAKVYVAPDAITRRDIFLEEGDTAASATGVVRGTAYSIRLPFHTQEVEDACKLIHFEYNI
jgi:hypothetical protein